MPAISVSVKPDVYIGLEKVASDTGLSKSMIVNIALRNYMNDLAEDLEDAQIAEKAWNDFVASGEKGIPLKDVKKELGL